MANLPVFTQGIPTLPPGNEIKFLFDSFLNREHLPEHLSSQGEIRGRRAEAMASQGEEGAVRRTDGARPSAYRHMSRIDRRDLHDIHERLKEIGAEIKKWTASGRGLLRLSPDDVRARHEAWEQAQHEHSEESERTETQVDGGDETKGEDEET